MTILLACGLCGGSIELAAIGALAGSSALATYVYNFRAVRGALAKLSRGNRPPAQVRRAAGAPIKR